MYVYNGDVEEHKWLSWILPKNQLFLYTGAAILLWQPCYMWPLMCFDCYKIETMVAMNTYDMVAKYSVIEVVMEIIHADGCHGNRAIFHETCK